MVDQLSLEPRAQWVLTKPRHQIAIGIGAVAVGVLAHRAFLLETELLVKPDGGRVVGEDVEFDPFQVMPVIGCIQQCFDEERSEALAGKIIVDAKPERRSVSSAAALGVKTGIAEKPAAPFSGDDDIGRGEGFNVFAGVGHALERLAQRAMSDAWHVQHGCQRLGIIRANAANDNVIDGKIDG